MAADDQPSKRPQARGLARREAILDAAVRRFSKRGFRGTGIIGLARRSASRRRRPPLNDDFRRRYALVRSFVAQASG